MIWLAIVWCVLSGFLAVGIGRLLSARPAAAETDSPDAATGTKTRCVESASEVRRRSALDRAIECLDRHDPVLAKMALLRWIGGLGVVEIAVVLGLDPERVERDLEVARRVLSSAPQHDDRRCDALGDCLVT